MQKPPANRGLNGYSLLAIAVDDCAIIACKYIKRSLTDLINQGNFKKNFSFRKVTCK